MPVMELNCRELPCPQPVMRLKRLLDADAPGSVTIIVDNEPALENVGRFLASRGYAFTVAQEDGIWRIAAVDQGGGAAAGEPLAPSEALREDAKTLVMLLAPVFGSGDDTLGAKLMKNFLTTLPEMEGGLWRIIMLNGGVTLAVEGSPVIEELRRLERDGVSILVCGTCLEHYGILSQKAVGTTTNMLDVVTSMQVADKVIRI